MKVKRCRHCQSQFIPKVRRFTFCSTLCYQKFLVAEGSFKEKFTQSLKGTKNPKWSSGRASQERARFRKNIVPQVLKRDGYSCQNCQAHGCRLHVDHIKSWAEYPELRFELSNLRSLCVPCHYQVTYNRPMPAGSKWGFRRMEVSDA